MGTASVGKLGIRGVFTGVALFAAIMAIALLAPDRALAEDLTYDGITFVEWTDALAAEQNGEGATAAKSQPSVAGNYYLTQNCGVQRGNGNQWHVPAGTTNLLLNGHQLYWSASMYSGRVAIVGTGATLHVYDQDGTGCISSGGGSGSNSEWNGAGVYVDGGAFFLHGGSIRENYSRSTGSGVYVNAGSFTMSGGTISDNHLTYNDSNGAAVYVANGATLTLTGGSVINNQPLFPSSGKGVYAASGAIVNIAGNPVVSGNGSNNAGFERQFFLDNGCVMNIVGDLDKGFCLPIWTQSAPTADSPIVLTSGLSSKGTELNFISERDAYAIRLNEQGEAELAVADQYDLWIGRHRLNAYNASDLMHDGSVKYDPQSNTLTLTNANITTWGGGTGDSNYAGILYGGTEPLNIVLSGDSVVVGADSARRYEDSWGICVGLGNRADLSITGSGTLQAVGGAAAYGNSSGEISYGIYVYGDLAVGEGCTVKGQGGAASSDSIGVAVYGNYNSSAQTSNGGNLTVAGTLEGTGGPSTYDDSRGVEAEVIALSGGTVKGAGSSANDSSFGISTSHFELSGGVLEGTGGSAANSESYGIYSVYVAKVQDGTLKATGGTSAKRDSYGLYVRDALTIDGGAVTATGGTMTGTSSSYGSTGICTSNRAATMTGGTVTATGGNSSTWSYGINCERGMAISGGTLKAVGGEATDTSIALRRATLNGGSTELIAGDADASYAAESLSFGSNVDVFVASPNPDGSDPVPFGGDPRSYRYLKTGRAYNLWVGGVRVTEVNAADILGDGTASYSGSTREGTLTLKNADITGVESSYGANIYVEGIELTIEAKGKNTVSGGEYGIFANYAYVDGSYVYPALAITGSGSLSAHVSSGSSAIYSYGALATNVAKLEATNDSNGYAIYNYYGSFTQDGGSTVATSAAGAGLVSPYYSMIISGGTLEATGSTQGINCSSLEVTGGAESVTATATSDAYNAVAIWMSSSGELTLGDKIIFVDPADAVVKYGPGYSSYKTVYDAKTDTAAKKVVIIHLRDISKASVTVPAQTYTGKALTPAPVVKYNGVTLKKGTDYTVSGYASNTNAGTATVTLVGKGIYEGKKAVKFTIKPASIAKASVAKVADQKATGKTVTPEPKVTLGGKTLRKGTDYTLSYANNVKPGTATITVKGKGNYTGSVKATFKIVSADKGWKRIAGAHRFETAALVSQEAFAKGSCSWAVVANGGDFPDALAASGLAGVRKGAVILVWGTKDSLNDEARAELKRLGVKNVYIMGGTGSVSAGVERDIKGMGIAVSKRFAGANRIETSVMAAREARAAGSKSDTVIVTTCWDYPDTLSVSPWSYAGGAPVVLTWTDRKMSADALAAIKAGGYKKAVIVSTNGAVDKSVESQLKGVGVKTVTRLEGADAYATNVKVVEWELKNGLNAEYPVVATYVKGFADALGGSALAGSKKSVIVLADSVTAPGIKTLAARKADRVQGYVLGGPATISDSLLKQIATTTGGKVVKS